MYLSVIIPAYNEADRISHTLSTVHTYLSKQDYEYEIIVVNDGSTDTTVEVVTEAIKTIPHLRIIDNAENRGKGWVVRQGMLSAKGFYRLFMDADNSTTIDNVERFLPYFKQGYDVLVSSRRIEGSVIDVPQTLLRDFLGGVFRSLIHIVVPLNVVDSQNGFKIFSGRSIEEIFHRQRTFTWAFDVEILAIAKLLNYKIKELPIYWTNDGRSRVTLKGMIKMLFEVGLIRLHLWTGTYNTRIAEEIQRG